MLTYAETTCGFLSARTMTRLHETRFLVSGSLAVASEIVISTKYNDVDRKKRNGMTG